MRRAVIAAVGVLGCGRLHFQTSDAIFGADARDGSSAGDGGPLSAVTYVKASNTAAGDYFGTGVALSADGTTFASGAIDEASDATGIGGNQVDTAAPGAGAVYVYVRAGATWMQQAYVKASNTNANDHFGLGTALSADGNTLAVGADGEASAATGIGGNELDNTAAFAGAVYVFARAGTTWTQQAYVKASNTDAGDLFGARVALSADGNTLAVGAPSEASAATGIDGQQNSNTRANSGAVYVYTRTSTTWTQQAYVKASNTDANDMFGSSVAVSADGNTLAVGAPFEESAATGVGGNQLDNTTAGAGAVYVFTRSGTTWSQQAYLKSSNTAMNYQFGKGVVLSSDGSTLAAGADLEASAATGVGGNQLDTSAPSAGAVYVFTRASTTWSQQAYLKPSNTQTGGQFGFENAIASDGSTLCVGSQGESSAATGLDGNQADRSAPIAGAAYVFTRAGTMWSQLHYVKASNTDGGDSFGTFLAISGDGATLAIAAHGEASAATGIDGDQSDNSAMAAGAAYIYQ